jgi:hypothetical protein
MEVSPSSLIKKFAPKHLVLPHPTLMDLGRKILPSFVAPFPMAVKQFFNGCEKLDIKITLLYFLATNRSSYQFSFKTGGLEKYKKKVRMLKTKEVS